MNVSDWLLYGLLATQNDRFILKQHLSPADGQRLLRDRHRFGGEHCWDCPMRRRGGSVGESLWALALVARRSLSLRTSPLTLALIRLLIQSEKTTKQGTREIANPFLMNCVRTECGTEIEGHSCLDFHKELSSRAAEFDISGPRRSTKPHSCVSLQFGSRWAERAVWKRDRRPRSTAGAASGEDDNGVEGTGGLGAEAVRRRDGHIGAQRGAVPTCGSGAEGGRAGLPRRGGMEKEKARGRLWKGDVLRRCQRRGPGAVVLLEGLLSLSASVELQE
jgi:hypothetical protein